MSARKKAKSSPKSMVPVAERLLDEVNLMAEAGVEKPADEASTSEAKMHSDASDEGLTPEADQPVADGGSNIVDRPLAGTGIVLSRGDPEVLDVTIEEPDYPVHEWEATPELPLIVPDSSMQDDNLVAFVHQAQGSINNRLRKTVHDYWLIGKALDVLFRRHDVETTGPDGKKIKSRWRDNWLPRLGYNHQTDQHLRAMATELTIEEIGQFDNKTKALQALGFSIGGVRKAIEQDKKERVQGANQEDAALEMAQPLGKTVIDAEPQGVANHQQVAKTKTKTNVKDKVSHEHKIAAKVAPQAEPLEVDPMVGTEALVVTLDGTADADLESVVAESGLIPIAKMPGRVVALLWYSDDTFEAASKKVGKALDRLRPEKQKLQVEARYLCASEVVPV